jgi:hypothetical protein
MRRCGRCGESKSTDSIAWRRKGRGQLDNYCRPCRAEYKQEHYRANKQRYVDNAAKRRRTEMEARMGFLLDFFSDNPCVDCGENDPVVLEFDHLGDKEFNITKGIRDRNWRAFSPRSRSARWCARTATAAGPLDVAASCAH